MGTSFIPTMIVAGSRVGWKEAPTYGKDMNSDWRSSIAFIEGTYLEKFVSWPNSPVAILQDDIDTMILNEFANSVRGEWTSALPDAFGIFSSDADSECAGPIGSGLGVETAGDNDAGRAGRNEIRVRARRREDHGASKSCVGRAIVVVGVAALVAAVSRVKSGVPILFLIFSEIAGWVPSRAVHRGLCSAWIRPGGTRPSTLATTQSQAFWLSSCDR